jgi:uncharacterized protein (DUF983 family)
MWRWWMARRGLRTLGRGLRLRCPACGHGHLFARGMRLNATCPYCWVRFERAHGESMGAVYITSALTALAIYGGYFALDALLGHDLALPLAIWIGVVIALNLFLFRLARALWIVGVYWTGGVYPDQDYERDYIAPTRLTIHDEERP